jgi:hypothetical protein
MEGVSVMETDSTNSATTGADTTTSTEPENTKPDGERVSFSVTFKKQTFPIVFGLDQTVGDLRQELARLTEVPAALQKLMLKGAALKNDSDTLRTAGIKDGTKMMLIGSQIADVLASATIDSKVAEKSFAAPVEKEWLSEKLPHKKIIDKGKPEDAIVGLQFKHEKLPPEPLSGILNNRGEKVRLTFKPQELWISTKASTQKIPYVTIKNVQSDPIKGHEQYHIVTLQLGSSEATRYFLYWVPAQYTRAITNTIMADFSEYF